jgi:hypothetical protein
MQRPKHKLVAAVSSVSATPVNDLDQHTPLFCQQAQFPRMGWSLEL